MTARRERLSAAELKRIRATYWELRRIADDPKYADIRSVQQSALEIIEKAHFRKQGRPLGPTGMAALEFAEMIVHVPLDPTGSGVVRIKPPKEVMEQFAEERNLDLDSLRTTLDRNLRNREEVMEQFAEYLDSLNSTINRKQEKRQRKK